MKARRYPRWSDHDRNFGPFTYAHDKGWRFAAVLSSGDDEDRGCMFRLTLFVHTLIVHLPRWILQPHRRRVEANWDRATVARMGRNYWHDVTRREYGVSCWEGFLQVFLGRQSHDSSTEQKWSAFLPWTQWRFICKRLYDLDGKLWRIEPSNASLDDWQQNRNECPSCWFAFADYDGEQLTARTRIEEREWKFGDGWFKWLSLFRCPKIVRVLDLYFSGETGRRKGSWKGGTIGHGIDMLPGELHEDAFRRYCAEHEMTFVHAALQPA